MAFPTRSLCNLVESRKMAFQTPSLCNLIESWKMAFLIPSLRNLTESRKMAFPTPSLYNLIESRKMAFSTPSLCNLIESQKMAFPAPSLCNLRAGLLEEAVLLSSVNFHFFYAFLFIVFMIWCWYSQLDSPNKWSTIMARFPSSDGDIQSCVVAIGFPFYLSLSNKSFPLTQILKCWKMK